MSAQVSARSEVVGSESARVFTPPRRELTPETSLGFECIRFAERVLKLELLPWQQWFLIHALELNEGGTFRFKEVHLLVARQNGKTTVMKALILWRLFVDDAELVLGAAQSLGDAEDTWEQVLDQADAITALRRRMLSPVRTNGKKALRLKGPNGRGVRGQYKVETLKPDAGRGKTADLLFLDELREHKSWDAWNALSSTTLVPRKGQIVTASNAGETKSVVLREKRQSAIDAITRGVGLDEVVGLFEWSAPEDCDIDDLDGWRQANPSLGHTITYDDIKAHRSKTEAGFRTENLCQWVEVLSTGVIPQDAWRACRDVASRPDAGSRVFAALDVSWDRAKAHIAIAALRPDGRMHVEVVASRPGTDWVVGWLTDRAGEGEHMFGSEVWFDGRLAIQTRGAPASSLIEPLTDAGIDVVDWSGPELAKSSGTYFDRIMQGQVAHLGQPVLDESAKTVRAKTAGDAWYFDRKNSPTDAAPFIACAGAAWLASQPVPKPWRSAYEDNEPMFV